MSDEKKTGPNPQETIEDAPEVTDAKEHTLEIRALASAADASRAWDLRCEIREQLVLFVQENYAASLPKFRVSLGGSKEVA